MSNKFADAVLLAGGACVCAVASRNADKANDFAVRHGIEKFYGDYEEMLIKEKPDGVYIGIVTSRHYDITMMCLKNRIPVICEKAMFTNSEQAMRCFSYAKTQNTFCMEAMWSRFLPAIVQAKKWVDEGRIGKVGYIQCNNGRVCPKEDNNRFYSKELGGGAAYDLLVYAYELSAFMHRGETVFQKSLTLFAHTGVDAQEQVILKYADEVMVSVAASITTQLDEKLVICGDKGRIEVPHAHFAKEALLYGKDRTVCEHFVDTETTNGYVYEVREFIECVKNGKLESDVIPHKDTVECCKIFDMVLKS